MNKQTAQHFCQTGAIDVLREVTHEIIAGMPRVEFDPNPHKLAYNLGKSDGAEIALVELVEYITKKANE